MNKIDCFAFKKNNSNGCNCLTRLNCNGCRFYKSKEKRKQDLEKSNELLRKRHTDVELSDIIAKYGLKGV